jgi:F0F1-type ATP synthase membrane subunit c/vacuolar-type H+-ATPase subunit K
MSIVERRSAESGAGTVAEDGEMSATTSIGVGLVVALAIYVIGSALLLQKFSAGVPRGAVRAEMSFLGP